MRYTSSCKELYKGSRSPGLKEEAPKAKLFKLAGCGGTGTVRFNIQVHEVVEVRRGYPKQQGKSIGNIEIKWARTNRRCDLAMP